MPGFIHNLTLSAVRLGLVPNAMKKALDNGTVYREEPSKKHREKFGITTEVFQKYPVHFYGTPKDGDPILYFCHGGGFVAGMFKVYYEAIGALQKELNFPAIVPDYPMPPEQDVLAMRAWALTHFKKVTAEFPKSPIILAGDSAGANMALALAQDLVEELGPQAKNEIMALYLLYGWFDLSRTEKEYPDNREEVLLEGPYMPKATDRFRGAIASVDPRISPLFGDMRELPLTRIISADKDMLYAESLALDMRLTQNDCAYTHNIHYGYGHDFWLFPTPDGKRATREMAEMMKAEVGLR